MFIDVMFYRFSTVLLRGHLTMSLIMSVGWCFKSMGYLSCCYGLFGPCTTTWKLYPHWCQYIWLIPSGSWVDCPLSQFLWIPIESNEIYRILWLLQYPTSKLTSKQLLLQLEIDDLQHKCYGRGESVREEMWMTWMRRLWLNLDLLWQGHQDFLKSLKVYFKMWM